MRCVAGPLGDLVALQGEPDDDGEQQPVQLRRADSGRERGVVCEVAPLVQCGRPGRAAAGGVGGEVIGSGGWLGDADERVGERTVQCVHSLGGRPVVRRLAGIVLFGHRLKIESAVGAGNLNASLLDPRRGSLVDVGSVPQRLGDACDRGGRALAGRRPRGSHPLHFRPGRYGCDRPTIGALSVSHRARPDLAAYGCARVRVPHGGGVWKGDTSGGGAVALGGGRVGGVDPHPRGDQP